MAQRLLYADDEDSLRELVRSHLSLEGFDVETARDGKEAVEAIDKQKFDLILLDLRMPKMDGFAVLQYLAKLQNPPPVIMLTGVDDVAIASQCIKMGAADYLTKPYNFHELIESVERVLAR
ncbi:MAG TPA: response regulator [Bacteroidota bacterium]|nr:response regulator [Bacteroidota bacterium]